jgi:hypothetical protein
MSTQFPTIAQAKTIRTDGGVEFVTHNTSIRPDRYKFSNQNELSAYLGQAVGGNADGGGVRGSLSRKGMYSRRAVDGGQVITFGDPVLDAISSPAGTLILGDKTIDLRAADGSPATMGPSGGAVVYAAPNLVFTGTVNGAERWATNDGSLVEYRVGNGMLAFHAWKKDTIYLYWSMGGEISVINTGTNFDAADIFAFSYMTVPGKPPCAVYNPGHSSDLNDNYLDQYDWGWHSQQPERVAVLCRAQWHHARFVDVLTAGSGCMNYLNEQWPLGFPPEWDTIETFPDLNGNWTDGSANSAVIAVKLKSLSVDMSAFHRPGAHGSVLNSSEISVTFPDDKTYTGTLQPPNSIRWSNGSVWSKIINTVMDLNGVWTDGTRKAVISEGVQSLKIDMSDYDRPGAHGSIVNGSTITVTFPDDATYTATLQPPNSIRWSNGSAWTRTHYL